MPHLRISLYLKVVITEMTFHPKLEDGGGVVATHSCLLGIVPHAHADVSATPTTPDVVGQLESN